MSQVATILELPLQVVSKQRNTKVRFSSILTIRTFAVARIESIHKIKITVNPHLKQLSFTYLYIFYKLTNKWYLTSELGHIQGFFNLNLEIPIRISLFRSFFTSAHNRCAHHLANDTQIIKLLHYLYCKERKQKH